MKKLIIILSLFLINSAFAIDWEMLKSKSGNTFELDKDSIREEKNYYFYNIKYFVDGNEDIILTIQSQKAHPFSKIINNYKNSQYVSLKGDYENITKNMTKDLEPVSYESTVFMAYKKVREIITQKNKPKITF